MKPAILFVPFLWISLIAQVQFYPGQRPPLPPQNQTGKASIEGSVVDSITHEPVKKASVMLNGGAGLSAVTDASGHFAFRQLAAGQYNIFVQNEKYPASQDSLDGNRQLSISLAADEQKQDITLSLTPGASVRGRIVDDEGNPMSGCNATAMQLRDMGMGRTLQQSGGSPTDEKGEYRISNLPGGKYYIQARCFKTTPLPHPFVRRDAIMDAPKLSYAPLFYPGAADPISAAKVQATPGADISGIDFKMVPARGITIRGHAGPASAGIIQLSLAPKDLLTREFRTQGQRVNASTGEFRIQNVLPGSYDLVASTAEGGQSYFAKTSVEVADAPLDPIELTLAPAPTVSGTILIEGDTNLPMTNGDLRMNPLDGRLMMQPPPQAKVQSDGTFVVNSVTPGHWRLFLGGVQGYIKSVQQGGQEATPWDLEIGPSPSQLKILVGAKYAKVEPTLSASTDGAGQIAGILWAADGDPNFQQNFSINTQNPGTIQVPPGKYHVCAFATAQPWVLMQNRALRKALESRCETVDAPADGSARVQLPVIPAADLKQILEKIEE
jgi:Carboxypeptidase regulatory-like domain